MAILRLCWFCYFIRWTPDAIVFNSYQSYGTPSYWVQQFFIESSGATLQNTTLQTTESDSLFASAISWQNSADQKNYLRIKVTQAMSKSPYIHLSELRSRFYFSISFKCQKGRSQTPIFDTGRSISLLIDDLAAVDYLPIFV